VRWPDLMLAVTAAVAALIAAVDLSESILRRWRLILRSILRGRRTCVGSTRRTSKPRSAVVALQAGLPAIPAASFLWADDRSRLGAPLAHGDGFARAVLWWRAGGHELTGQLEAEYSAPDPPPVDADAARAEGRSRSRTDNVVASRGKRKHPASSCCTAETTAGSRDRRPSTSARMFVSGERSPGMRCSTASGDEAAPIRQT